MGTGITIESDIISLTIFAGLLSLLPVTILLWVYYVGEKKPTISGGMIAQIFGLGMVSVGIAGVLEREIFSFIGMAREWIGLLASEAYAFQSILVPIASISNSLARAMFAEHVPADSIGSILSLAVIAFLAIALVEEGTRWFLMRLVLRDGDDMPIWYSRIFIVGVLVMIAGAIYNAVPLFYGATIPSVVQSFIVMKSGYMAPGGAALLLIIFLLIARGISKSRIAPTRLIDGVLLGIVIGLGFAFIENTIYFLHTFQQTELSTVLIVFFLRFILSTTAHMTFGGVMGYYLVLSVLHAERRTGMMRRALWVPVLMHGSFDFLLIAGLPIYVIFLLTGALFVLWRLWGNKQLFERYRMHGKVLQSPIPHRRVVPSPPFSRPVDILSNEDSCPVCYTPINKDDTRCVSCGVLFTRRKQEDHLPSPLSNLKPLGIK